MKRLILTALAATLILAPSAGASIASTNEPGPSVAYLTVHEGKPGSQVTVVGSAKVVQSNEIGAAPRQRSRAAKR